MKRNLLYLLCVILVIGLTACDVSEEISDIPCQESSTSEVSKISDNESIASNESDNKAETNQQKSDTLKMSIDFSRISEDGAVIALEVEGLYDAFDKGNHVSEYEPWSIEKTAEFDNVNAVISAVFSFFEKTIRERKDTGKRQQGIAKGWQMCYNSVKFASRIERGADMRNVNSHLQEVKILKNAVPALQYDGRLPLEVWKSIALEKLAALLGLPLDNRHLAW